MKYTMKDFEAGKVGVLTDNIERFRKFMNMCEKHGYRWNSGDKPMNFVPIDFNHDTVIFARGEKTILYGSVDYAFETDVQVISVNDIIDEPKRRIVIEFDGDETTANLVVDGEIVKKTTAKRAPCDKFNLRTGAEVAFNRLWEKKMKEENKEKTDCTQFKVGNRVRFTDKSSSISTGPKYGATGTVIAHDSNCKSWLVQFDKAIKGGHAGRTTIHDDIEPTGRNGYCWWCPNCFIERI